MSEPAQRELVRIGTMTPWGRVEAVGFVQERYYWLVDKCGYVSMMPAQVVESAPLGD